MHTTAIVKYNGAYAISRNIFMSDNTANFIHVSLTITH